MSNKVIVLGIDGATFDLLYPWIEQGKLPNLARVLREGTHSVMRSTIPPYSAQAWVSMMTGKNPAKHGVVDFFEPGSGGMDRGFVSSTLIKGEAIWDTLSRHGKRVGIVNVPLTYPPSPVNGYMISGFLTPKGRDDYAYPPELRDEILNITGEYDPDPWDLLTPSQNLGSFVHWMEITEQAARYLQKTHSVDFFISVIQGLDQLQHLFWDVLVDETTRNKRPTAEIWPSLERCYEAADAVIGHRLNLLEEETTLFLVSDHGFQSVKARFNVNCWLAERGFLKFDEGQMGRVKSTLNRIGLTRENLKVLVRRLDAFGLRRHVGRLTRATIANKLGDTLALPVDWSQTVAYSGTRTSEGIYINLKGREPYGIVEPGEQYEVVRKQVMAALAELVDPRTGQPAASAVYRREEIYNGEYLHLMPDILFSLDGKPYLTSDSTTATQVFEPIPKDDVHGRHHSLGIFAAIGRHVVPGLALEQTNIVDVAPTILYAMDLPIPTDMDGQVLEKAFTAEYRHAHPICYEEPGTGSPRDNRVTPAYSEEEEAEMHRRLRGLGYIS